MSLTLTVTAGYDWPDGQPIELPALRKAALPSVSIDGSVATGDLAAGAVTAAKSAPDAYWYGLSSFVDPTYSLALNPALTAYADGVEVWFNTGAGGTNTGAINLDVNSLGSKPVYKGDQEALAPGDLVASRVYGVRYNSALNGGSGGWKLISRVANGHRYVTTTGSANAYVATNGSTPNTPVLTDLGALDGVPFYFRANFENTGVATLNVDGLGAKAIRKWNDVALAGGDIKDGHLCVAIYDAQANGAAGAFILINPSTPALLVGQDAGSTDAYVLTLTQAPGAYVTGQTFLFKANTANDGAATLNVNSIGAVAIRKHKDQALAGGDIKAGQWVEVVYDGTNFQLLGPASPKGNLTAWCKFDGNATSISFGTPDVDLVNDEITVSSHGITAATDEESAQLVILRSTGTVPGGTTANTPYYAYVVDANTVSLHTSRAGAVDGTTDKVNLTSEGTGTRNLTYIALDAAYGMLGVRQSTSGGVLTVGEYVLHWATAFSTGAYVVTGMAQNTAGGGCHLQIDQGDANDTATKTIQAVNETPASINPDQVHIMAVGE